MPSGDHEPYESETSPVPPEPDPDDTPFTTPPMEPIEEGLGKEGEYRERA